MSRSFSFTCPDCGERHDGAPSLGFSAPFYWDADSGASDPANNKLTRDLCVVRGADFFIRCVLDIPIVGADEPFTWGVWVSQSESNYRAYESAFPDTPERTTFGYFSNRLPGYSDTLGLHAQAHWQLGRERPWIEIQVSDHPLYRDTVQGISWERAVELAVPVIHSSSERGAAASTVGTPVRSRSSRLH